MLMIINLVEDYNIYLCEGGPVYNGGVQPTPITYLTQWKIVGNSEVHTDPYLTSWKVEGNSVVDNNTILSCGDLGQDGMYHVKISNGVDIYDIALNEPLRKACSASDSIEFSNGTAVITRNIKSVLIGNCTVIYNPTNTSGVYRWNIANDAKKIPLSGIIKNVISNRYDSVTSGNTFSRVEGVSVDGDGNVMIFDNNFTASTDATNFKNANADVEVIYELETPTTETIQVSPFPVSSTDTYTSANVTPYSAFEHTENKEIWSCGEYNATDGKYHILVQPQGGSIADIALTEPLRKVNDVADSIEFPSGTEGKALVTRNIAFATFLDLLPTFIERNTSNANKCRWRVYDNNNIKLATASTTANILCNMYVSKSTNDTYSCRDGISASQGGGVHFFDIYDEECCLSTDAAKFRNKIAGINIAYELETPTTELVDAPQIEEAESYSCVISQGSKAVSWSSFETNSE